MAIVSTGQITIVDNNDAKPIASYITGSAGFQQIYDPSGTYSPDWSTSTGMVLTARAFIGAVGAVNDVTYLLTNRKFYIGAGGTAITGTGDFISSNADLATYFVQGAGYTFTVAHPTGGGSASTITIDSNLLTTANPCVIFFEGDYTDTATGLVTKVVSTVTLTLVKMGSNAVYVVLRGADAVINSETATKNTIAVAADLVKSTGIDTTNVNYKFFYNNASTMTQIYSGSPADVSTKYGFSSSTSPALPSPVAVGTAIPASAGAANTNNTLTISELAVSGSGIFRVDVIDLDDGNKTYTAYFTITDVSDPYRVVITSSSGDKLQNGTGSTTLTPSVYNGATAVSSLTGWNFTWTFYDKNGKRAGFVDPGDTTVGGYYFASGSGKTISDYVGTTRVVTHGVVTTAMPAATSVVKIVMPDGNVYYFETSASSTTTCTLKNSATTWISTSDFMPSASDDFYNGGVLYLCTASGGIRSTTSNAAITVTGYDIDVKGTISVSADRP